MNKKNFLPLLFVFIISSNKLKADDNIYINSNNIT